MTMPPLPTGHTIGCGVFNGQKLFTDDQMRAYGEACAAAERERLIAAIGAMLHCPCCGETIDCSDDCTFAVDCPADADNLSVLRDAVRAERRAKREQE